MDSISLHINNCRFLNNSSPLVVTDSIVKVTNTEFYYNTGHNGGVLYAEQSSNVSFYKCSFSDNTANEGGVLFTDNADIHVIASNFTRNSATNGGVFQISGYLFMAHCMMANNTAELDGGVGYVEENSKVNITTNIFRSNSGFNDGGVLPVRKSIVNVWNSSFIQNSAGFRGGIAYVEYNSAINITQTTYFGNKGIYGGVFTAKKNTTVFVHKSKILQNSADDCKAFILESSSRLEISFSKTYRNSANQKVQALCALDNSLFIFKSSLFKGNTGLINLHTSAGYLENCTLIGNQRQNVVAISIFISELSLSNTVLEQNIEQDGAVIESATDLTTLINRLYTYRCLMKHGNIMLKSNATNFKKTAIKEHFIEEFPENSLATEETQFASSELLSSEICYFLYTNYK